MPSSTKAAPDDAPADLQYGRIRQISAGLFAKKGYASVGVAEIGESVGLGRGALYYHIGSKEELLYDIVIRYIADLVTAGTQVLKDNPEPTRQIELLSRHMMKVISENLAEMTVCFRDSDCLTGERHASAAKLHGDYQALWVKAINDGVKTGDFRRLPPVAIKGFLGMYFHSFLWLNPKGKSSSNQIADVFSDIVLRALAPDKPIRSKAKPGS